MLQHTEITLPQHVYGKVEAPSVAVAGNEEKETE
jgi:hypothetical protein